MSDAFSSTITVTKSPGGNSYVPGANEGGGAVNFTPINEYIGATLQDLYGWTNNSVFYMMSNATVRPFYRLVQNWEYWINGFVPTFHNIANGCVPTRLAKTIVDKVSALIYGGGVMFGNIGEQVDKEGKNSSLDYVSSEWVQKTHFKEVLQDAIRMHCSHGTSVLKLNVDKEKTPWVDAQPFNRFFLDLNAKGDVTRALFYVKPYTRTGEDRDGGVSFHLIEERFFREENGKSVPFVQYSVYMTSQTVNQFSPGSGSYSWEQLPHFVRKSLKEDFGDIRIGEPKKLPLVSLGVYPLRFTPSSSKMPWIKFGDSVLEGVIDKLCNYDLLSAAMRTEIYSSRARIIAKKGYQGQRGAGINANAGIDDFLYTDYESTDMADKGITVMQPELRADQFKSMRNGILEEIASAIGISPSSFAPYLQDNSNRTAREVSAEESATALFVENHRDLISKPINDLLSDVTGYKGFIDKVAIKWSKAGQSNYTLLTENVAKLRQAGLISLEQAVAEINPGMDESQLKKEIELIKAEASEQQGEEEGMFDDLDFGNATDPTAEEDGENLTSEV